jgi:hypothetical protein
MAVCVWINLPATPTRAQTAPDAGMTASPPGAAVPAPAPATQPADVPVKSVTLFSSGVGYFEHFGIVHGNATTELRFKTDQINDILKSLVLQDMDDGAVSTITYPSQDPIDKTLKSFQVDITANPSLADLLNQLRGAPVTLSQMAQKFSGTVLGVEKRSVPTGANTHPVEEAVLNLLDGATIRQIAIKDITDITLDDPTLQGELTKALAALAGARDQDKKPVVIGFTGTGDRRVRIGYVVETPVWKTSYRLILGDPDAPATQPSSNPGAPTTQPGQSPEPGQTAAYLQGWAIVENQTDNDWNGIQLNLVSGRPISFVQDLYQPLYIPRPVVQPDVYASLTPQTYSGGMDAAAPGQAWQGQPPVAAPMAAEAPAPAGTLDGVGGRREMKLMQMAARTRDVGGDSSPSEDEADKFDAKASVVAAASAGKLGELFQYAIRNPVTLPRQKSAMIPIIGSEIAAQRVSIYNASVLPRNPLSGVELKNTTGNHLLAGPVTVLDGGGYAGDARLDNVPPGQDRLISYGIDLETLVDSTASTEDDSLVTGKIVKGVLTLTRKHQFKQTYSVENKSPRDKTIIIEHPFRDGWSLVNTPAPMEKTDSVYRFKGTAPAGKTMLLAVTEQVVQDETTEILPCDLGTLITYSQTGEIPQPVRDALAKAAQLKQATVDTQGKIATDQQKIADITNEQNRIRENMKTVDNNSAYYMRLLKKLNDQESQLESNQSEIDDLQKQLQQQQQELETYVNGLTLG